MQNLPVIISEMPVSTNFFWYNSKYCQTVPTSVVFLHVGGIEEPRHSNCLYRIYHKCRYLIISVVLLVPWVINMPTRCDVIIMGENSV